ncbi:hypothetical protein ACFVTX_07345 [Agromyces sp. NPDC058136]|uniref:hypothetical protein n=1 Tax=Agromyces sp. NPDC058136 TaxID=3346354 RepID=UPI0036DE85A8
MTALKRVVVSRRALLQGAAVASGYLLTLDAQTSAFATAGGTVPVAPVSADRLTLATTKIFNAEWNQAMLASFPARYRFSPRSDISTVGIEWDERLFSLHGPALGLVGESAHELEITRPSPHAALVSVPAETTDLVLRVEALNTYPAENHTGVRPVSLWLEDQSGQRLEEWTDSPIPADCAAWSIEATVNWISHEGDIVPARASIRSIGPFDAPAGTAVRLSYPDIFDTPPTVVDPAIIEGDDTPLPATVDSRTSEGICELVLTTTEPLRPGGQLELHFEAGASNSTPRPFANHVPRLVLVPPTDQNGMRLSGRHSSFPVSPSGSQLSSYIPAPIA